jgi:hypothetical protein
MDRGWIAAQLPSMRPSRTPHHATALAFLVSLFHSDILPAHCYATLSSFISFTPQTRKRLAQPVRAGNSARHDPSAVGASLHCNLQFFQFLFPAVSRACSLLICADNFLTCRPAVTLLLRLRTCAACGRNRNVTNKNPNPANICALRFVGLSPARPRSVGDTSPEASPRAKSVDCCDLGLSPAENGRIPGGTGFDFVGIKNTRGSR